MHHFLDATHYRTDHNSIADSQFRVKGLRCLESDLAAVCWPTARKRVVPRFAVIAESSRVNESRVRR